jgi:hypothetical protein
MQEINFVPVHVQSVLTTPFRLLALVVFFILLTIITLNMV